MAGLTFLDGVQTAVHGMGPPGTGVTGLAGTGAYREAAAAAAGRSPLTAGLAPFVVAAVAFAVFCLVDLARAEDVRYLPRWAWAIICLVSIPIGGIVYLIVGRSR